MRNWLSHLKNDHHVKFLFKKNEPCEDENSALVSILSAFDDSFDEDDIRYSFQSRFMGFFSTDSCWNINDGSLQKAFNTISTLSARTSLTLRYFSVFFEEIGSSFSSFLKYFIVSDGYFSR